MGIDCGQRRVGVALAEAGFAHPAQTLEWAGDPTPLLSALVALIEAEEVDEVIVGLPLTLAGQEGASARRARRLGELIAARTGKRVVMWDERFTTQEAERALQAQGVKGARRKKVIDQVAASILLQSYLDAQTG